MEAEFASQLLDLLEQVVVAVERLAASARADVQTQRAIRLAGEALDRANRIRPLLDLVD